MSNGVRVHHSLGASADQVHIGHIVEAQTAQDKATGPGLIFFHLWFVHGVFVAG